MPTGKAERVAEVFGQLTMPTVVRIRVAPYRDSDEVIEADLRLRWRMEGSAVKFRFVFPEAVDDRLEEIHEQACASVVRQTGVPLFRVAGELV